MDTRDLGLVVAGAGAGAASVTAYQAWRAATERTVLDGKPTTLARVDAGRVIADPETFQFKSGGDAKGVTDRLKGVKSWNPAAAGKVMVFERADGQQVIADGHQRTGLAQRLMADGHAPIKLDAIVLREKDGWSARDVRAYAAIKNMHESSGNPLDMAKVMRERPDLVTSSLPVTDAKIRDAKALANLSDPAFRMVTSGTVKPELAAAVGEQVKEASRHVDLLTEMAKAKVETAQHAKLYVGQALAGPSATESNLSLFGEEQQTRSLIAERAQVLDRAMTALRSDKRIFGLLEREASSIEAVGNKLAHEVNAARAEGAGKTAVLVEKLSTVRGPLSSMLDEAARQVADGKKPTEAARAFVRQVGATLRDGGIKALTSDGPAGWSDQARAASAGVRQANARVMEMVDKPEKPGWKLGITAPKSQFEGWTGYVRGPDGQKYRVPGPTSSSTHDTKRAFMLEANRLVNRLSQGAATFPTTSSPDAPSPKPAAQQSSFLPDPTTKEKIAAASKGKASVPQKDAGGLFSDDAKQMDIVDEARKAEAAAPKNKPWAVIDTDTGKPVYHMGSGKEARSWASVHNADEADGSGRKGRYKVERTVPTNNEVAIAKINAELREMFSRSPDGKHRHVDGTPLPERPGWSDEARAASAEVRKADAKPANIAGNPGSSPADQAARYAKKAGMKATVFRDAVNNHLAAQGKPPVPARASMQQIGAHLETHMGADGAHRVMGKLVEGDYAPAARKPVSIMGDNKYGAAPGAPTQSQKNALVQKGGPAPDFAKVKAAAAEAGVRLPDMSKEKPTPLTDYQRQFQAGPRQPDYRGDPSADGKPTSKSRGQLLAEAREKGLKGIAKMETRTLASKLGYKLNYALGAMTIGGAAAAGLLAADAARNSAQAAGKSEADTQLATMKAGVVATAVAGGTIAAIGKGIQLAVAAAPKIAPFVTPVGAAVGVGYAAYGAYHGYQQTGTMKGAALGAVSGGHVFESWRKPSAGPVRLSIAQQAAFAAASLEHQAKQDAATPDDGKRSGWSNAARIAAAQAQNHAAPYGGNPYAGPAQWAPPAPATTAETTTASITAAMKRK